MGRWTKERHAQEAGKKADVAARAVQSVEVQPETVEPETVEPDFQPVKPSDNPRDAAMDEIISRHEKPLETEPPLAVEVAKTEPESQPPAVPPIVAEVVKTVRVKVDGKEFDVPQSEVDEAGGVHNFQRDRASDNRLKKMSDALAETKRTQVAMAEWAKNLVESKPAQPDQTEDEFIASKVDTIRFGTPEESAVALREVLHRASPKYDQNKLLNQAVTQVRRQAAIDSFKRDFPDVVTSPLLLKLASTIENDVIAKIPKETAESHQFASQFDWGTFYGRIGHQIRSVTGKQSQPALVPVAATASEVAAVATASTPSQPSGKEARKASIITLPTAAARAELPKEEKLESRDDIIRDMRKSRGLPTD